eukprot:tig00021346_g20371.t1
MSQPPRDTDLVKTLREWDRGSKHTRLRILQAFVARNKNKTGPQLEKEYGNGASLLLARISTWLRLTYLIGSAVSLQLQAVSVFIAASSGQRFLTEFLEVGGVNTLLEILGLERIGEDDRQQTFQVLQHIANSGRYYKELICENEGVRVIAECLGRTRDEGTLDAGRNLLTNLGRARPTRPSAPPPAPRAEASGRGRAGNPRHCARVQAGVGRPPLSLAQALRVLLQANPPRAKGSGPPPTGLVQPDASTVQAAVLMLRSFNFQVQYEAYELLKVLGGYHELERPVLDSLIAALRPNLAEFDAAAHFAEQAAAAAADGGELQRGQRLYHPLHTQQACAAKMLGILAGLSRAWATRMTRRNVVGGLLTCLSNLDHYESQKQGGQTLFGLCSLLPRAAEVTKKLLGADLFETFMKHPDMLYRDMTSELVQVLHKAAKEGEAMEAAGGEASGSEGEEAGPAGPQASGSGSGSGEAGQAGPAGGPEAVQHGGASNSDLHAAAERETKGRPRGSMASVASRTSVASRVEASPGPDRRASGVPTLQAPPGSKRGSVAGPGHVPPKPQKKSEAEQLGLWAPMVMEDSAGNTLAASMFSRSEAARGLAADESSAEHDALKQKIEKLAEEPIVERQPFPTHGDEPEYIESDLAVEGVEGRGGGEGASGSQTPVRSRPVSRASVPVLHVGGP